MQAQNIDTSITVPFLGKKKRVNIYLPEGVLKIIDRLAKGSSRGEVISKIVLKEAGIDFSSKTPYGIFKEVEFSDKELEEITKIWDKNL